MTIELGKVHPELAARFERVRTACAALGVTIIPTQGLRTIAEQDALYAKGRTAPGKIVTNARGGSSLHNFGRAIDFAFLVDGKASWDDRLPWALVGAMGVHLGLEWGGAWVRFPDRPHFQYLADGATLASLRADAGI